MNPILLGPTAIENVTALAAVSLSSEGKELLPSAKTPADFLHGLIERRRFGDALRVYPYVVGVRQAVWWATLCSWHGTNRRPTPGEDAAFAAVVRWLQVPSEPHYQAAVKIAASETVTTPGEHCARAVSWAGYLSGPNGPWLAVEPRAAARTAGGCAFLAMARADRNGVVADEKQLLKLGLAVADGALPWDDETTKGAAK